MKKITIYISLIIVLILIALSGYFISTKNQIASKPAGINYYLPTEKTDKYCNGADMDSEGFRKTITYQFNEPKELKNLSRKQIIVLTLKTAAENSGFSIFNNIDDDYLKIISDTAYIQPIEGWAGISIFLCYWKPFIEVNLLQFPEIRNVVWITSEEEWDELGE